MPKGTSLLTFFLGQGFVHVRRQDAVVVVVVEVVALPIGHGDLAEPLDHAPSREARHDQTNGKAVIGRQPSVVLLVGQHDVVGRIQGVT